MEKLREWSFPVLFLLGWVAVSAYTVSELAAAQSAAAAAQRPSLLAPTIEVVAPPASNELSLEPRAERKPKA